VLRALPQLNDITHIIYKFKPTANRMPIRRNLQFNINANPWQPSVERIEHSYYPDGSLESEEYYIDDDLMEFRSWYDDGSIKMMVIYDSKTDLFNEITYYKFSGVKKTIYTYFKHKIMYGPTIKEFDFTGKEI
jgi:hypothetical protein